MSASNPPPVPLSPIPTPSLSNTSILITGGASGLGLATVHALAAAGAHITVTTNVPIAPSILSSLQASGYHVQEVVCDVADWDSPHGSFKHALAFSPTRALDVVAIFAGVDNGPNLVGHVGRLDAEGEPKPPSTAELDVNLKGSLYTSALALHYFRGEAGQGRDKSLIFVSSLAGYIDETHNSVYTASKFGTRGLWRSTRVRAGAEMGRALQSDRAVGDQDADDGTNPGGDGYDGDQRGRGHHVCEGRDGCGGCDEMHWR